MENDERVSDEMEKQMNRGQENDGQESVIDENYVVN